MDDRTILQHIEDLSNEEFRLEESHAGAKPPVEEVTRLKAIEVQLDQAYDLLRQRRARRIAGQNPDDATERSSSVVENYLQ